MFVVVVLVASLLGGFTCVQARSHYPFRDFPKTWVMHYVGFLANVVTFMLVFNEIIRHH